MTLRQFPLDGTIGAAATASNTGLTSVVAAGTATAVFNNTVTPYQGTSYLGLTGDATNAAYGNAPFNVSSNTGAVSFGFHIPNSMPAADLVVGRIYDVNSSTILSVVFRTTGAVVVADKSTTYNTLLTTAQATAATWFRLELVVKALSGTAGSWTARAFNLAGTLVGTALTVTTGNTGTAQLSFFRFGITSAMAYGVRVDGVQTNDGTVSEIGAYVTVNKPPVVSAGPDQTVTAGSTVTLRGTATDQDGTVASVQWTAISYPGSAPTITNATSSTATFTAAPGVYVLQFAATDNSGATSTDQCTISVPAASVTVISEGENSGAWSGAYTDLADTSDSTYVQSSGSGTNTFRLAPIVANTSLVLTVRAAQSGTGAALTVTLLQGTTTIAAWTLSSLTSTPTDYPLALTSTQVAAITNWNALDVRFS